MKSIRLIVCFLFVALVGVCPVEATSEGAAGNFTALSLTWSEPGVTGHGKLAALVNRITDPTTTPPLEDSGFEIVADTLQVAWDLSDLYFETDAAYFPGLANATIHQGSDSFNQTVVRGEASRHERFLYLMPTQGVTATLECAAAEKSANIQVSSESKLNVRGAVSRDTSKTLQLTPCPGSEVTISGSFVVVLWEWDARLDSAEGSRDLWSGKAPQETAPAAGDLRPYASRAQQLYLTVTDGSFTMRGNIHRPPILYASSWNLAEASSVALNGARGVFSDLPPISGAQIELQGAIAAQIRWSSAGLALDATGIEGVVVNGAPSAIHAVAPQIQNSPWSWTWLGWLALPVIALAAWWLHRNASLSGLEIRAWKAAEIPGQEGKVVRLSSRILRRVENHVQALLLRAHAYQRLQRQDDALLDLRKALHVGSRDTKGPVAIELSRSLSQMGRELEAVEMLGVAYVENPGFARQAAQEIPELRRLWVPTPDYS